MIEKMTLKRYTRRQHDEESRRNNRLGSMVDTAMAAKPWGSNSHAGSHHQDRLA